MVSPAPQVQIDPVVDLLPGDAAVPNVKAPWPQALPVLSERADDWSPHPPVDRVIAFRALLI